MGAEAMDELIDLRWNHFEQKR